MAPSRGGQPSGRRGRVKPRAARTVAHPGVRPTAVPRTSPGDPRRARRQRCRTQPNKGSDTTNLHAEGSANNISLVSAKVSLSWPPTVISGSNVSKILHARRVRRYLENTTKTPLSGVSTHPFYVANPSLASHHGTDRIGNVAPREQQRGDPKIGVPFGTRLLLARGCCDGGGGARRLRPQVQTSTFSAMARASSTSTPR
jgi:hypothetical protein